MLYKQAGVPGAAVAVAGAGAAPVLRRRRLRCPWLGGACARLPRCARLPERAGMLLIRSKALSGLLPAGAPSA